MNTKPIIFILIGLCCGLGCSPRHPIHQHAESYMVKRIDLRDVITQIGQVQPVFKVELKSEASGKIERIPIKEGQQVHKGDTILVIDPDRLRTQRQKNYLIGQQSKLNCDLSLRDLQNAQKLIATGIVSQNTIQDLQSRYEATNIDYKLKMLELKDVDDQLKKTIITAPIDGVITQLLVKEGEIAVSATSGFQGGTAIGTIADISNLEVITQVGEVDYIHLKQLQKAIIRLEAIEGVQTHGTISFIAMSANRKTNEELGTFEVRVSIDSLISGIAAGINVKVEFVIMEKKNVIAIPSRFVIKNGQTFNVQIIPSGNKKSIETRPIQIGVTDFRNYEILSGLYVGDIVVTENMESLYDKRTVAGSIKSNE